MLIERACVCWALLLIAAPSGAFEVAPGKQPGEWLKWGDSHRAGTPGGEVTWGFLAEGTPGAEFCGIYCKGKSLAALPNFYPHPESDNSTTPMPLTALRPIFEAALDAWSAVADVRFRYVGVDASLSAIDDPAATTPMIRIGVYRFDGLPAYFVAAATFAPPPNGRSGAGELLLNANVGFQLSTSPPNSPLPAFPSGGGLHMSELYQLALHEIGHALGLGHSMDPDALLWGGGPSPACVPTCVWRTPRADDVAGAQFLYGAPRPARRPE